MKRTSRITSLVLAIFLFIGICTPGAKAAGGSIKTGIAFVDATSLRLRSGPGKTYATLDYAYGNEVLVVVIKSSLNSSLHSVADYKDLHFAELSCLV